MTLDLKTELRKLAYFAEIPEGSLDEVAAGSSIETITGGQVLIEEGTDADCLFLITDGELVVTKLSGGRSITLARVGAGDVQGEFALLEGGKRSATVTALTDVSYIRIDRDAVDRLLAEPGVVLQMLKTVVARLRDTELIVRTEERMAGLGRMAAGLMHDMNNPIAAVRQGSRSLEAALNSLVSLTEAIARAGQPIPTLRVEPIESLSTLDRSSREDDVTDLLEEIGLDDPWAAAASLVDGGWTADRLRTVLSKYQERHLPNLIRWIAAKASIDVLATEIGLGAERVSDLVAAVKRFSYMDQAAIQNIVVTDGIEDTLKIMGHKLRSGVTVIRHYPEHPMTIEAHGAELNQVWTNLIENSLDAMSGSGELRIDVVNKQDSVEVRVADNGPGIQPDLAEKVFDPFFTTKELGKGSGLGLSTAHRIITRHGGRIVLEPSETGTSFLVTLPLQVRGVQDAGVS